MPPETPGANRWQPPSWPRMVVVQLVQVPALALVLASPHAAAWWLAGLWGSVVCCVGTDSHWRWRNRLLVLQAAAWLTLAMVLGGVQGAPS